MINYKRRAIKELDKNILILVVKLQNEKLTSEEREEIGKRLQENLAYKEVLEKKSETKVIETEILIPIIQGLFGFGAIGMVLYYEKKDVITSKIFGLATRMVGV